MGNTAEPNAGSVPAAIHDDQSGAPGGPIRPDDGTDELAAAQDLISGPPSPRREYAVGLEHALMWACLATVAPPVAPPHPMPAPPPPRGGDAPVYRAST